VPCRRRISAAVELENERHGARSIHDKTCRIRQIGNHRSSLSPAIEESAGMEDNTMGIRTILVRWMPLGILAAVVIGAVATFLIARWRSPDVVEVNLAQVTSVDGQIVAPAAVDVLNIAVASMLTPSTNFDAYGGLIDYLGNRLGQKTRLVQRVTYGEVNQLIADGEVDLAFVCSGAYIELRQKKVAEILVVPMVDGATTYHSLILARKNLEVGSLDDLRGSTFAFVDPLSNTGFLFPSWRIHQRGETAESFFRETVFSNSHEYSIGMVAGGMVDAAAVDNLVFDAVVAERPELRDKVQIVEQSAGFGIPPVVVRTGVDPAVKSAFREALLSTHENDAGRESLDRLGFDRFVLGNEEDYDRVEEMMTVIQAGSPR
jgi:phosphonate transport system substrate-binding protein